MPTNKNAQLRYQILDNIEPFEHPSLVSIVTKVRSRGVKEKSGTISARDKRKEGKKGSKSQKHLNPEDL